MLKFEYIEFLYGLLSIPIFFFIYYIYRRWRRRKLRSLGDIDSIKSLINNYSGSKPFWKFIVMMLAYAFLLIGLSNPQIGTKLEEIKRKGIELVIALDVSNSMNAEDIKPNRLDKAKQEISYLFDVLDNDKIGIVVFAGKSFIQMPLTMDYSAARMLLSSITTDIINSQGTAIGSAIETAQNMYSNDNSKSRVLILFSDGENHEDDALVAAKNASNQNIIIYTIGIGTTNGSPIPIYRNNKIAGFMKDQHDNSVISKLDPSLLQKIAEETKGEFYLTQNINLVNIVEKINNMEKIEFGTKQFTNYESRFQYFIGLSFIFLIVELLMTEYKSKSKSLLAKYLGLYKR